MLFELFSSSSDPEAGIFYPLDVCEGMKEEVSLAFYNVSFAQRVDLDGPVTLNISVFNVPNMAVSTTNCVFRDINMTSASTQLIWKHTSSVVRARATTFKNIVRIVPPSEDFHSNYYDATSIAICADCIFRECSFHDIHIQAAVVRGGLFLIWGSAEFYDCSFARNNAIADYGCGLIFSSPSNSEEISLKLERSEFLQHSFLPSHPPPVDPYKPLNLTLAAIACMLQTSSIVVTVKECNFVDNSASAVGLFTVHASDILFLDPNTIVFGIYDTNFTSSETRDFGSAAILRIALTLPSEHPTGVNHSLVIHNVRFEGTKSPSSAIAPTRGSLYADTLRTEPTLMQVSSLAGLVKLSNITITSALSTPSASREGVVFGAAFTESPPATNGPSLSDASRIHIHSADSVEFSDIRIESVEPDAGPGGWLWTQMVHTVTVSNLVATQVHQFGRAESNDDPHLRDEATLAQDGANFAGFSSSSHKRSQFSNFERMELLKFEGERKKAGSVIYVSNITLEDYQSLDPTRLISVSNYDEIIIRGLNITGLKQTLITTLIEVSGNTLTLANCSFLQLRALLKASVSSFIAEDIRIEDYTGTVTPMDVVAAYTATFSRLYVLRSTYSTIVVSGSATKVHIRDSYFSEVRSAVIGGVASVRTSGDFWTPVPQFIVESSNFTFNSGASGGALACPTSCNLTIINSNFDGNIASRGCGGAVFVSKNSLTVKDSIFTRNSADTDGGAICTYSSVTMKNSTLKSNSAHKLGGAISSMLLGSRGDFLHVETSAFLVNDATVGGGAIYVPGPESLLSIIHSYFQLNRVTSLSDQKTSESFGGALLTSATTDLLNVTFKTNSAHYGGSVAVLAYDALLVLTTTNRPNVSKKPLPLPTFRAVDVLFDKSIGYQGAGMFARQLPGSPNTTWIPEFERSTFYQCVARTSNVGSQGGGLALDQVGIDFSRSVNLVFNNNRAQAGAAIYISHSPTTVTDLSSVTLINNQAILCGSDILYGSIDEAPRDPVSPQAERTPKEPSSNVTAALWGPYYATLDLDFLAVIMPGKPAFPGEATYSYITQPIEDIQYTTYPGAERILQIFARDQFGQTALQVSQLYDLELRFVCNSSLHRCDLLDFHYSVLPSLDSFALVQVSFHLAQPGQSALLSSPIVGYLELTANSRQAHIAPKVVRNAIIVKGCGSGYGEAISHRQSSSSSRWTVSKATKSSLKLRVQSSAVESLLDASSLPFRSSSSFNLEMLSGSHFPDDSPDSAQGDYYTCQICPRFQYSLNGTCESCALDPSIDSCEADQISAPATWWVMVDAKRNTYKSFRCSESYCGSNNYCLLKRTGIMCGSCIRGTSESLTSICVDCRQPNWPLIFVFVLGLWIAVLVLHSMLAASSGKATILIFFIQTAWGIRSQIPVASSNSPFSVFLTTRALLCLWPMDFIQRKILLASVPFIMMVQLSITFAVYHAFQAIRRSISSKLSSVADKDDYSPLLSESPLASLDRNFDDEFRALEHRESIGYGAESDEESDSSEDSIAPSSEHTSGIDSNNDELIEKGLESDEESEESSLSKFGSSPLSVSSNFILAGEEPSSSLDPIAVVDFLVAEETRVWTLQNAYFHHYRLIRTLLSLFANSFSSVLGVIMSTLGCIDLLDGSRVLAASPSISCHSSQVQMMRKLYGLFIPWLLIVAGFIFGKLIHSYLKNKLSRTDVRFGVWYEMYKPKLFGWKIVEFIRRALVATIGDLLISDRVIRASLLSVVMLLSLAVNLIASPYRHRLENNLESISLFFLSFIGLLVLWQARETIATPVPGMLSFIFMIVIGIVLTAAFGYRPLKAKLVALWERLKQKRRQHH